MEIQHSFDPSTPLSSIPTSSHPCSYKATLLKAPHHPYRGNSKPQKASVFPKKSAAGITHCKLWNPETKCDLILSAFPHPAHLLVIHLIWLRGAMANNDCHLNKMTNRWTCLWGNIEIGLSGINRSIVAVGGAIPWDRWGSRPSRKKKAHWIPAFISLWSLTVDALWPAVMNWALKLTPRISPSFLKGSLGNLSEQKEK